MRVRVRVGVRDEGAGEGEGKGESEGESEDDAEDEAEGEAKGLGKGNGPKVSLVTSSASSVIRCCAWAPIASHSSVSTSERTHPEAAVGLLLEKHRLRFRGAPFVEGAAASGRLAANHKCSAAALAAKREGRVDESAAILPALRHLE